MRHVPSSSDVLTSLGITGASGGQCEVRYYRDDTEYAPFFDWRDELDPALRKQVIYAINRMKEGNFSDSKSLRGTGLFERRIEGLRIYYAKLSASSVLILHGGDKSEQQRDIEIAADRLADWRGRHPK